jgi:hypothetical protein
MKSTKDNNEYNETLPSDKDQNAGFLASENASLKEEISSLKNSVAWFENQIFGQTSEKRIIG